jgi:hypothetical protein
MTPGWVTFLFHFRRQGTNSINHNFGVSKIDQHTDQRGEHTAHIPLPGALRFEFTRNASVGLLALLLFAEKPLERGHMCPQNPVPCISVVDGVPSAASVLFRVSVVSTKESADLQYAIDPSTVQFTQGTPASCKLIWIARFWNSMPKARLSRNP